MQSEKATRWVEEYGDLLYKYTIPRVHDTGIAKDLVQETFLAAWRNIDNFRGDMSEKNWLFTILKNKIIDHFRKSHTRLTSHYAGIADEESYFDETGHWAKSAYPKDWGVEADYKIHQKEFLSILEKCKSKLKHAQNAVFTMKYFEGVESEAICKELDITASNYWVLLHRAKLHLRSCLEKNWLQQ